jgi:hypothetical protein
MTTNAAFERCVTGLCAKSFKRKSNGIAAPCRPQRDTGTVGFSEIHGHIRGCKRTCREICDIQANHEEDVGYGKARSRHASREHSNEAQDLQVETICTTFRPCPFRQYYLRNVTIPSSRFDRTSMMPGRSFWFQKHDGQGRSMRKYESMILVEFRGSVN